MKSILPMETERASQREIKPACCQSLIIVPPRALEHRLPRREWANASAEALWGAVRCPPPCLSKDEDLVYCGLSLVLDEW